MTLNLGFTAMRDRLKLPALLAAAALLSAAGPASAQPTVTSQFGDWKVICETPPGATSQQCGISNFVADAERPEELGLSVVVLIPADRKTPLMRMQAPLGILLWKGIGLEVDGKDFGVAHFTKCFRDGCWAEAEFDATLLDSLKKGKQAFFKLFLTPEEGIAFPVDLKGFTEAFAKIS